VARDPLSPPTDVLVGLAAVADGELAAAAKRLEEARWQERQAEERFLLHWRELEPAQRSEFVEAALVAVKERRPGVVALIEELREGPTTLEDPEADA
jgi:hypothetical protein